MRKFQMADLLKEGLVAQVTVAVDKLNWKFR
jgi:hypothetical protein